MNTQFLGFNADADAAIKDATVRAKIIAVALAKALADSAALPTSPVESSSNFFNTQIAPTLSNVVSKWNENMVFDARGCIDIVRTLWTVRYTAAHPNINTSYQFDCGYFECLFGVPVIVSDDLCKFLDEHKRAVILLAASASKLIASQGNNNG